VGVGWAYDEVCEGLLMGLLNISFDLLLPQRKTTIDCLKSMGALIRSVCGTNSLRNPQVS